MESEQVFVSSQSPDEDAGETKAYNSIGSLSILLICPECQETPPNIFENTSSGDTVCLSCGLVLGEHMVDTRSEWRTFSDHNTRDNDPCRVGNAADPLFDGSQLETRISWDGSSRSRALNRAQTLLRDNTNNSNLTAAYTRIYTICQTLHLTDDATRLAQAIYKEVYNQDAFKRKNVNKTIAGCVFIASRKTKHDRTFKDITEASGVTVKDLSWAFKAIEHFFKQHKKTTQQETAVTSSPDAEKGTTIVVMLAERYCQGLLLPRPTCRIAAEVAEKFVASGVIAGRTPMSIAAAAVYFASHLMGHPKSSDDIAAVATISAETIRKSYKLVHAEKEKLIEERWLNDGGKSSSLPEPSRRPNATARPEQSNSQS